MNWIKEGTVLNGKFVELIPLHEKHFDELEVLAREKRIWEFMPADMSSVEKCNITFKNALLEREKGTQYPFVIIHKHQNKIIGSTRLMDIQAAHQKLEIGWTWLHPDYWASVVNLECKLLLLTFCFEELKTIRVQLKTDENNLRSQKAIGKIGGIYEGTLRQDWIRENKTVRSTAYFSILNSEWQGVKIKLKALVENIK